MYLDRGIYQIKSGIKRNKLALATVNTLMQKHLIECPTSMVVYRKKYFINFMLTFGNKRIYEITKKDLTKWYEQIKKDQNIKTITTKGVRGFFNHFFDYLVEEEVIPYNPQRDIRFKAKEAPSKERIVLSPKELRRILTLLKNQKRKYLYNFVYILLSTGARRSEILDLKWKDINFDLGTITLRKTKNGDDRILKISRRLQLFLSKLKNKKACSYVISTSEGKRFSNVHFYKILKLFKKRNPEQKNWTYHDLRHSFAHNFLKNGGNMYSLQAILGHKSINITIDLYGQLKASDVENPCPYDF